MRQLRRRDAVLNHVGNSQSADIIYVLAEGRMVEKGTHSELIAKGGVRPLTVFVARGLAATARTTKLTSKHNLPSAFAPYSSIMTWWLNRDWTAGRKELVEVFGKREGYITPCRKPDRLQVRTICRRCVSLRNSIAMHDSVVHTCKKGLSTPPALTE